MRVKKMVSVSIKKGETITVPSGEFWKVTVSVKGVGNGKLNGIYIPYLQTYRFEFVENQSLGNDSNDAMTICLQGLAFEF